MPKSVPTVTIELDKVRTLKLDFNALADFEEVTGKELKDLSGGLQARELRALVWAGIRHEDESLTLRKVGEMLHLGNLQDVVDAINDLVKAVADLKNE